MLRSKLTSTTTTQVTNNDKENIRTFEGEEDMNIEKKNIYALVNELRIEVLSLVMHSMNDLY